MVSEAGVYLFICLVLIVMTVVIHRRSSSRLFGDTITCQADADCKDPKLVCDPTSKTCVPKATPSFLEFVNSEHFDTIFQFWLFYGRTSDQLRNLMILPNQAGWIPITWKISSPTCDNTTYTGDFHQMDQYYAPEDSAVYGMGPNNTGDGTIRFKLHECSKGRPDKCNDRTIVDIVPTVLMGFDSNKMCGDPGSQVLSWSKYDGDTFHYIFQAFLNDDTYVLPTLAQVQAAGSYLTAATPYLQAFGGQNISNIYKYLCCYTVANSLMPSSMLNNLCKPSSYTQTGSGPTQVCTDFMTNTWCKPPDGKTSVDPSQIECGCFDSYPLNQDDINTVIYESVKDKVPRECVLPVCAAGTGYKTTDEMNTKCPSVCAAVIQVDGSEYSTVNFNNVNIQLDCGSGGQVIVKPCSTTTDCKDGYTCQQGTCQASVCSSTSDCISAGKVCKNKACVPCVDGSSDCADQGKICQNGSCVSPSPSCRTDSDCPQGQVCDQKSGKCMAKPSGCTKKEDCLTWQDCQDGKCVTSPGKCATNADCPSGKVCQNNVCITPGCTLDTDCPSGQVCQNGACVNTGGDESFFSKYKLYIGLVVFVIILFFALRR